MAYKSVGLQFSLKPRIITGYKVVACIGAVAV